MHITFKQILTTGLALIVTLAALYAGRLLYHNTTIKTPLTHALAQVKGVRTVRVGGSETHTGVQIWLTSQGQLATIYPTVQNIITAIVGHALPIRIMDNPTTAEINLYNQLRFVVAQGEATGHYVTMAQAVQQAAAKAGDHAQLVLGRNEIFLTLVDDAHHRLMAVMPLNIGGGHV